VGCGASEKHLQWTKAKKDHHKTFYGKFKENIMEQKEGEGELELEQREGPRLVVPDVETVVGREPNARQLREQAAKRDDSRYKKKK